MTMRLPQDPMLRSVIIAAAIVCVVFALPVIYVIREYIQCQSVLRRVDETLRNFSLGSVCGHKVANSLRPRFRTDSVFDCNVFIEPYHDYDAALIAGIPQSFSGCALAVADIDGDGRNELLSGTSPDSRLYVHRYDKKTRTFTTELFAEKLAGFGCDENRTNVAGSVGNILVSDINGDGRKEIIALTDQQLEDSNMKLWVFSPTGNQWYKNSVVVQSPSHWTRGMAALDADGDGVQEVFSLHDKGHIFRHTFSRDLRRISCNLQMQLDGSGIGLEIADVFNTGQRKFVVSHTTGSRARVSIFGLTRQGLTQSPEAFVAACNGREFSYVTTCTADIDSDGKKELVVGCIAEQANQGFLNFLVYKFDKRGTILNQRALLPWNRQCYPGEFEGMMISAATPPGAKDTKLFVSIDRIRLDDPFHAGEHERDWGLYQLDVTARSPLLKIANFNPALNKELSGLKSLRFCIGDLDSDGQDELAVSLGRNRESMKQHGKRSYIFLLERPRVLPAE